MRYTSFIKTGFFLNYGSPYIAFFIKLERVHLLIILLNRMIHTYLRIYIFTYIIRYNDQKNSEKYF